MRPNVQFKDRFSIFQCFDMKTGSAPLVPDFGKVAGIGDGETELSLRNDFDAYILGQSDERIYGL